MSTKLNAALGSIGTLGIVWLTTWIWRRMRTQDTSHMRNKVVLITGASSGVGEACAKLFYRAGLKVILCSRRKHELERVKKELLNTKMKEGITRHEPHIIVLDLEDIVSIQEKVDDIISIYHSIDILVNNAGIGSRGDVCSTSLDVFIKLMNVNYIGQVAITKAVLPYMIKQKSGHIITVSSIQGKIAIPFRAAYAASKHAMQAFCDSLRAEICHHNISVSVLSPSYINTNLSVNAITGDGTKYGVTDPASSSGMSPEYVARHVVQTACNQTKELLLCNFLHKLAVYLRNILPDLYFALMKSRARKQKSAKGQ